LWCQLIPKIGKKQHWIIRILLAPSNVRFGSVAAGSLHFSDSMAWGAAYGQKRTFTDQRKTPPKRGLMLSIEHR
jgi:hypothetical protein